MIVEQTQLERESNTDIHKIVVAVDLSEHSKKTMSYAAGIARCLNASLALVHVFKADAMFEYPSEKTYQLAESQRHQYEARLADMADAVNGLKVKCETALLMGDPAERIGEYARDMGVDLIITASHHPKFLARLFNLDKAPQIVHRAPCPVLVYHEKDE